MSDREPARVESRRFEVDKSFKDVEQYFTIDALNAIKQEILEKEFSFAAGEKHRPLEKIKRRLLKANKIGIATHMLSVADAQLLANGPSVEHFLQLKKSVGEHIPMKKDFEVISSEPEQTVLPHEVVEMNLFRYRYFENAIRILVGYPLSKEIALFLQKIGASENMTIKFQQNLINQFKKRSIPKGEFTLEMAKKLYNSPQKTDEILFQFPLKENNTKNESLKPPSPDTDLRYGSGKRGGGNLGEGNSRTNPQPHPDNQYK